MAKCQIRRELTYKDKEATYIKEVNNMQDIIGTVAEKAGISETQAKMAVAAVVERFDDKLPGPIAAQVKKALGIDTEGMLGGVAGDLMGGASEGASGIADMAKGILGGAAGAAGDAAGGAAGGLGDLGDMAKGLLGGK